MIASFVVAALIGTAVGVAIGAVQIVGIYAASRARRRRYYAEWVAERSARRATSTPYPEEKP